MSTASNIDYVPIVPFENGSCSYFSKGLKLFPAIMAICMVAMAVYAALIYTQSIPFNLSEFSWVPRLAIAAAVLAPILTIALVSAWKCAYNEIYPQGSWIDFLKRDWTDFLGDNHQHYSKWKEPQTK